MTDTNEYVTITVTYRPSVGFSLKKFFSAGGFYIKILRNSIRRLIVNISFSCDVASKIKAVGYS